MVNTRELERFKSHYRQLYGNPQRALLRASGKDLYPEQAERIRQLEALEEIEIELADQLEPFTERNERLEDWVHARDGELAVAQREGKHLLVVTVHRLTTYTELAKQIRELSARLTDCQREASRVVKLNTEFGASAETHGAALEAKDEAHKKALTEACQKALIGASQKHDAALGAKDQEHKKASQKHNAALRAKDETCQKALTEASQKHNAVLRAENEEHKKSLQAQNGTFDEAL